MSGTIGLPSQNIFANPTRYTFGASANQPLPLSARYFVLATCTVAPPTVRTLTVAANKTHLIFNAGVNPFVLAYTSGSLTINPGEMIYISWSGTLAAHEAIETTVDLGLEDVFEWEPFSAVVPPPPPPPVDIDPDPLSFSALTNAVVSTTYISNPVTITGVDALYDYGSGGEPVGIPTLVSGAASTLYSVNSAPFTASPGFVYLNDVIRLSVTSSASNSTAVVATIQCGATIGNFSVTTAGVPPDVTPGQFTFTDVTDATPSQAYTSPVTITGINAPATASIVGPAGCRWSKNGSAFVDALLTSGTSTTVQNADVITLEITASSTFSTAKSCTMTITGVTDTFTVTTQAAPVPDTVPDQFTFSDVTNVSTSSTQTSNTITVLGINSPAAITVTGGTYSKNGAAFTSGAGTVASGDQVRAQHTSSASNSTAVNTVVTIGGVSDTFTSTTAASAGATTTSLASPSWLVEAEDYPKTKIGLDYRVDNYQTRFPWDAGLGGTVTVCNTTAEMNAAIVAAKTNSTIKGIHLNPGSYTWTNNSLSGINRPVGDPFFIRTTPGSNSQAIMSRIWEETGNASGLAFVDLEVRSGLIIRGPFGNSTGSYTNVLVERCVGWVEFQGRNLGTTPGLPAPGTPFTNGIVRLCELSDHWGAPGNNLTHGIYAWNMDGLLMEGNVIDHNGWDPNNARSLPDSSGGPNMRKHNCYLNNPIANLVARFNWNSRSSSHGFHMKGGGTCYRNIMSRNPIHIQACYGGDGNAANYPIPTQVLVRDNLIVGTSDINPTNPRGTGIHLNWVDGGMYRNNTMVFDRTSVTNSRRFFVEQNFICNATIQDNVAYGWVGGNITIAGGSVTPNITQSGNVWSAASISPTAQALAYQLGGDVFDPGVDSTSAVMDAWVDNYKISRRRLGVDINQLKSWMSTIIGGITP